MRPIDKILERLDTKPNGKNKYMARCPAHDDGSPSLAIGEGQDGKVILHCFAGCQVYDIVTSLGLELGDLFPDNHPSSRVGRRDKDLAVLRSAQRKHAAGKKLDKLELNRVEAAIERLYG